MVTQGIDLGCNEVELLTGWGVSTTAAVDVGESSMAGWSGGGERRWLGHGAAVSSGRGLGSGCWVGDGLRWATHSEVQLGDGGGGGMLMGGGLCRLISTAVAQCKAQRRAEALERDVRIVRGGKSSSLSLMVCSSG
jgi:hypothetical protein